MGLIIWKKIKKIKRINKKQGYGVTTFECSFETDCQ